jgi:hypothetical protein
MLEKRPVVASVLMNERRFIAGPHAPALVTVGE